MTTRWIYELSPARLNNSRGYTYVTWNGITYLYFDQCLLLPDGKVEGLKFTADRFLAKRKAHRLQRRKLRTMIRQYARKYTIAVFTPNGIAKNKRKREIKLAELWKFVENSNLHPFVLLQIARNQKIGGNEVYSKVVRAVYGEEDAKYLIYFPAIKNKLREAIEASIYSYIESLFKLGSYQDERFEKCFWEEE